MENINNEAEHLKIDIGKVLKKQKPWILRNMPGFMVRFIERVIHQEELNQIFSNLKDDIGYDFVHGLREQFELKTSVVGEENLPEHDSLIFTLNHSMGALEGIAALSYLLGRYDEIKVLANNLLMNVKNARPYLLPVNVFAKTDKESMIRIAQVYESEQNIFTFPAGNVSRIIDGKVRDRDWHKSFVQNSVRYKRKVVPIFIENINSKRFYRVFKFRKFFGIKANLELFLLPSEVFRGKGQTIRMKIGKPISHTVFSDKHTPFEWAQKVKEHVYSFEHDHNKEFLG